MGREIEGTGCTTGPDDNGFRRVLRRFRTRDILTVGALEVERLILVI